MASSTENVDGRPSRSHSSGTYAPRTIPPLSGMEWSSIPLEQTYMVQLTYDCFLLEVYYIVYIAGSAGSKFCVHNKYIFPLT